MTHSVLAAPTTPTPGAPRPRRNSGGGRPFWSALVVVIALLVAAPVLAVLVDVTTGSAPALPQGLGSMVVTTLLLMVGVGIGTLTIGCGLAWLVTAYTFPLRNVFVWLLVLPLAMPAYILGFVFLSTFDVSGPLQTWLRDTLGSGAGLPPVRSLGGCIVVMSLTLYPYVYLLARAAFSEQAPSTYDAARTLGASPSRAFFRVLLPLARPSLAAGLALVMMEVLTDFATVQYFGVTTVSRGVYSVWTGTYDFGSAAQLSSLVLVFAVAVLVGERFLRGRARYTQHGGRGRGLPQGRLDGWRRWAATGLCLLALGAGFLLPVLRLGWWAVEQARGGGEDELDGGRLLEYLTNSVVVAALAAVVCVLLAVVVAHALRLGGGRMVRAGAQLTTFGYAVPGAVIGIGTLLAFAAVDRGLEAAGVEGGTGLLVTGSVVGILYAYAVRFLGPAYQAVEASFSKVSPSMTQSAMSLGASPGRILRAVHLPLARPGVAVGLVLVAIDAIKELPVVLLLRPFGFTTVSVWVYQLAAENFWKLAAAPALLIVVLAVVPVFWICRQIRSADRVQAG